MGTSNEDFPKVKNWGRGLGYYVMPLVGDCRVYVPCPREEEAALDFIDDLEEFSLFQQCATSWIKPSMEFTLEPSGDFEK